MVNDVHSKEFLALIALQIAGYSNELIAKSCKATNANRLKDFCYASPKTIQDILKDFQDPSLGEFCIKKPNPLHLIQALYF
jgi:hypothetical protein